MEAKEEHKASVKSDYVICILTRAYVGSENCEVEWTSSYKKIIPVRFEAFTPPGLLNPRAYIDLYGLDKEASRNKLITEIKGKVRPEDEPDALFASSSSSSSSSSDEREPEFSLPKPLDNYGIKHNLEPRNKNFTGREDILFEIYTGLQSGSPVSLIGGGGYGKTQTAKEYAYLYASEYKLIWRFKAESETQLQTDYHAFVRRNTNILDTNKLEFESVQRVIDDFLNKNTPYLLIYDNAEGCENLNKYLPRPLLGHIFINSRERLRGVTAEKVAITVFSTQDAVDFLSKRIKDANVDDAKALAEALGGLPLALECAAAYIEENQYALREYLKLWKKHELRVLAEVPTAMEYDKTALTTWNTTFDRINEEAKHDEKSKAALQLFKLCSYCSPDSIPLQLFIDGRAEIPPPLSSELVPEYELSHNEIITKLTRYSLISMSRAGNGGILITVHRLMQAVVRQNLNEEKNKDYIAYCLNTANVIDYKYATKEDFDRFELDLPHISAIARFSESFLSGDEALKKVAHVYFIAGKGLSEKGEYAEALEYYNKALVIYENVLGVEHPDTAATYNNIATLYIDQNFPVFVRYAFDDFFTVQ